MAAARGAQPQDPRMSLDAMLPPSMQQQQRRSSTLQQLSQSVAMDKVRSVCGTAGGEGTAQPRGALHVCAYRSRFCKMMCRGYACTVF